MEEKECTLATKKHIFLHDGEMTLDSRLTKEFEYIKQNFCGLVFNVEKFNDFICSFDTIIYFCGDVKKHYDGIHMKNKSLFVVTEFSNNYDTGSTKYKLINIGQIPINISNVGVFFRNFFNEKDYFSLISAQHKFQTLTESNKSTNAFRTGIYLTKVKEVENETKFKLLRCSSNLNGPTDNFRQTDYEIIDQVNDVSKYFFEGSAELNHVLAQIYENKIVDGVKKKERKAKIKAHSDKTKDMPRNALIAFCTFYKDLYKSYDVNTLTKIRFRLKDVVSSDLNLTKKFDVILYPNSVFIISLWANRLYTHEIVPSSKSIDDIPTRMGYVIRSSKTDAIFKDDCTYICDNNVYTKIKEADDDGVKQLKETYYKENSTDEMIHYDKFNFSLNKGDYQKPIF